VKSIIDQTQRIGSVPLSRSIDFLEYSAVGADEYGQGQPRCAQHVFHLQSGIDEMADGRIRILQHAFGLIGIVIRRDADDRKILLSVAPREPLQRRHFLPAGTAPARPNIDDQRPAAKRAQSALRTVQPFERRFPQHPSDRHLQRTIREHRRARDHEAEQEGA